MGVILYGMKALRMGAVVFAAVVVLYLIVIAFIPE
jgi:hypothetical protein